MKYLIFFFIIIGLLGSCSSQKSTTMELNKRIHGKIIEYIDYKLIESAASGKFEFQSGKIQSPEEISLFNEEILKVEFKEEPFAATALGEIIVYFTDDSTLEIKPIYNMADEAYFKLIYIQDSQYIISDKMLDLIESWRFK